MNTFKNYLKFNLSDKKQEVVIENEIQHSVLSLLEMANKTLERYYSGKYKFQLMESDGGMLPDKLKLSPKSKRKIKEKWLEFNSELSKIQRGYEKFLQENKKD